MCGTFWISVRCLFPSLFISVWKKSFQFRIIARRGAETMGGKCNSFEFLDDETPMEGPKNTETKQTTVSLPPEFNPHSFWGKRSLPRFRMRLMSGGGIIIHCPNWQPCPEYMHARFKIVFGGRHTHSKFRNERVSLFEMCSIVFSDWFASVEMWIEY